MQISKQEAIYLKENGFSEFVVRSTSHSKNYHLLCSDKAREELDKYHKSISK